MNRNIISSLFITLLFCSLFILSISLVSAYTDIRGYVQKGVDAFVGIVEPILQAIFGGTSWDSAMLFEKLLLFILLVSLVYIALESIPALSGSKGIIKIIALIVPLIGVRYLDHNWITAIIFQYQLLAIALAGILPFILYFFFLQKIGEEFGLIRKIGWIFFIAVYFGLWSTAPENSYSEIYFWTMVGALVVLLFDNSIQSYLVRQDIARAGKNSIIEHIAALDERINKIRSMTSIPIADINKAVKPLEKDRDKAIKQMSRIK